LEEIVMKRFAWVASASLALLLGACDDDSPTKKDAASDVRPEVGTEAGSEGGVPGQCVGTFASTNRTVLGAAVAAKPTAMCKASADLDLICTQDIGGQIRNNYAKACLLALPGGNDAVISCINEGVKRDFPTLSAGCLSCYTASVACTLEKCLVACSADATSAPCLTCQTNMGCIAAFFNCSGLPGGPPGPDGGTADAPADTGGTPDGGADSPVDAPPADTAVDTAADTATDTGSDV
jgi:hypothetical protein